MATDVDQAYYGWSHEQLSDQDEIQDASVSQMLDHGSISFGRFAFEPLEWQRRSVFTYNKCQEELEKFKSPGLVAQKKAYFEEYYKKIRALKKAMQVNQQTELALEYGCDGSISSQTGEEDETTLLVDCPGGGASNVIDNCSKEASFAITLEQKHDKPIQVRHLDLEPILRIPDSPSKDLVETDQGRNSSYAHIVESSDSGSTVHESLVRREEVKQHGLGGSGCNEVSWKFGKSESIFELEKNSSYDAQIYSLEKESIVHESLIRENIEQHEVSNLDVKCVSTKYDSSETDNGPEVSSRRDVSYPTNPNTEDSDLIAVCHAPVKTQPTIKRFKDHISVPKVKGPAASVSKGLNSEIKTSSDIKSSRGPKDSFQRTISKRNNSVDSSKKTTDRVSRNYRSTPVASPKPLTELRPNITTPRPFALTSERRSAAPESTRDTAHRLGSKTPSRLVSSLNQSKDVKNVQDTSKKAAIRHGVKSRGLENKRDPEEMRKTGSSLDKQRTNPKGRGTNVPGPSENRMARSLNISAHNQYQTVASENRCTITGRKGKQGEGEEETSSKEVRVNDTKIIAHRAGNLKIESKKVVSSRPSHQLHERKPQIGGLPHTGTKPRQEVPRWR